MKRVLKNAKCYTMDESGSVISAILIEDGLIKAVGTDEEVLRMASASAEILNAGGKAVLPGFYDSHLYLLSYGYSKTMVYLSLKY